MDDFLSHYHWLSSCDGAETLAKASAMRDAGLGDLKIGEELRRHLDPDRAALVLTQLDVRARAASKFSRASEMIFTRAGYEQATSETIAHYRARRFAEYGRIVELCCGIGGDLIALAGLGARITPVDRDPVHLLLAEHNARIYHPQAEISPLLANVEDVELTSTDAVFIDPARRQSSGKRIGYESEPSVEWSVALADRVAAVAIKTAPGIPHELAPPGWELELIALGPDLKEAVMWSPSLATTPVRATVIAGDEVTSLTQLPGDDVPIRDAEPGDWLHDVNPAVTNAGLVEDLARTISAERIDAEIGFLISHQACSHAMVSSWRVLDVLPWHEKRIKQAIARLDIGPIDIRRRGLAGDVPAITKRLRGKGNRRAMIAMTRMNDVPTAIICSLE